ncbi:phage tail protein [Paenibacillus alvei]|uniref:phage tail spike protein n=1 Tax=Paenibacillus alvei TaxID=44250 RepID=UPI00227E9EFC|nr:phage tail spike protein [Paenibacillus alvei]MCY9758379.1 phage tail protein [Paenibacillus alvei]
MLRLGDIDFNRKPVTPQLFMCKPNKQSISKMSEAYNIRFSQKLGTLNELNFTLPMYIEKHHSINRNENADKIKGRYLVKLVLGSYTEFFVITNLNKSGKDSGEELEIQALSLGFEMNDKILRDYTAVSKTATEILNEIMIDTIWKVGYVDAEFDLKRRGLEVSSSTVLEQVFEVAKTFNALVVWDTLKRTVSFQKPDLVGLNKGFKIRYGKYLEQLNQDDNAEEIITRLKMYGKEDISIREINPTGTTYIEDFNYFVYPYQEVRKYSMKNYSSTDIKRSWEHTASDWADRNGVLVCNANSKTLIANASATSDRNYKVTSTLKATSGDKVMGMVVRCQDAKNYYFVGWESGKINGGVGWGTDHLRIYKVENGISTLLARTSLVDGWSMNVHYNMTVEAYNDNIKVWIDNHLSISAKDSTYANGKYGFYGDSQPFEVSNVVVVNKEHDVIDHSDYMSDELCHTIIEYDALLQGNKDKFAELVAKREAFNGVLNVKRNELTALKAELKILLDERDVLNTRIAKMNDDIDHADNTFQDKTILIGDRDALLVELNAKLIEIKAKESEIRMKEAEIIVQEQNAQGVLHEIDLLKTLLDVRNNFTAELLAERNQYIIEKEWQDSNIEDPKDLLAEGIKAFNEFKEQKITIKVDIANFLSMITEQRNWDKLGLGDTINIEHERLQVLFKAKLTEIEYDFEGSGINITVSNVKDLYANKDKFLDMLYKSYSTSTQVSIDSWKWDLAMENKGSINEIINNVWDANKQAILGAKDQVIEISDRGLIIRDPNDPKNYLVGLNSMIAITNDGGNTWKHAITSTGIVGERIYGKIFMGVNLALEDEDGVLKFQGSKGEIFDRNGRLVMKLGLVDQNPDKFGLWSFNDVTRVKLDQIEGFVIDRATTDTNKHPDGWEKILWADPKDGTLYSLNMVAQNIKVVNNVGDVIIDSENNYLDIGDFNTIVMDNKLTTMEKMQIITELYKIESGYHRMLEQAEEYKRSQRDDDFDMNAQFFTKTPSTIDLYSTKELTKAYHDLLDYMSQYIDIVGREPLNININSPKTDQTSEIPDRAEFILKFKTYYDEEKNLRNMIEDAQFYSGLNMGEFYNNVVIGSYGFVALRNDGKYRSVLNATNGLALQKWEKGRWVNKVYGAIGNSSYEDGTLIAEDLVAKRLRIETKFGDVLLDADALNFDFSILDSIILDDVITSLEKINLANQYKSITKQYDALKKQINRYATTIYNDRDSSYYGLDDAKNQLVSAGDELTSTYNALTSYMNPVFANMNETTHIVRDLHSTRFIFHTKWEDFYKAYEGARAKLADFLEKSSLQLGRNYNNTVIDAENGVVVTRGNMMNKTTLNATYGIKIERNDGTAQSPVWYKVFYADVDGNLFAEDMSTKRLRILDAELGDAIVFDWKEGITIYGRHKEVIRLNANEGIAIDVDNDKRLWIHNDGTLRARKLIIEPDMDGELILDEETDGYISDLMVNSLKTVEKNGVSQDYVYIRNNFIKLNTGNSSKSDITKFMLHLRRGNGDSYPEMVFGQGNGVGGNIGTIKKDNTGLFFRYTNDLGNIRAVDLSFSQTDAVKVYTVGGEVKVESDMKITFVCGSSTITMTPSGIKISSTRIDLN